MKIKKGGDFSYLNNKYDGWMFTFVGILFIAFLIFIGIKFPGHGGVPI